MLQQQEYVTASGYLKKVIYMAFAASLLWQFSLQFLDGPQQATL